MSKYVMVVTSEDERYEKGIFGLSDYADNPFEGQLEAIIHGDNFGELYGNGEHEGLFFVLWDEESRKRISYGVLDPDTPREEIEEYEGDKENRKKKLEERWNAFLDAVDIVCGECSFCEEICDLCIVRKTVERMKRMDHMEGR